MYIRKTKTRVINDVDHFTYRVVESRRDENDKVKQHTLLNLGAHYDLVPETDHSILAQRVDNIITGQLSLLPLSEALLRTTQKIKTGYNALCLATQYRTINANIIQSI